MDRVKWRSIRNAWLVSNEPPNHLGPWPHSDAQIDRVGRQQSATTLSDCNIPSFSYPKFIQVWEVLWIIVAKDFLTVLSVICHPWNNFYFLFSSLTFVPLHCHFGSAVSYLSNPEGFFYCSEGFLFKGSGDLIELSVRFLSSVTFIWNFWETKIDTNVT